MNRRTCFGFGENSIENEKQNFLFKGKFIFIHLLVSIEMKMENLIFMKIFLLSRRFYSNPLNFNVDIPRK